jgi:glycerol kinase
MARYILAIDQGTTGSTALLVNDKGDILYKENEEFRQIFPKAGWVEHNLEDIWASVGNTIRKVLSRAKSDGLKNVENNIACIGITNQRETVGIWERSSHKPVHNAIVWQCRRTTDFCKKNKVEEKWIKRKTGLVLDPYFSASKIHWLLKNVKGLKPKARKGELAAGTIDSFLVWRLTSGKSHVTDVSNASRTMLMDLKTCKWDKHLLDFFKISPKLLPEIKSSSEVFGKTCGLKFLPDGIPISGIAGDQQAALFGQACFSEGDAKCTYGTGSFLLMNTGKTLVRSKSGMLTTVAWKLGDKKETVYALEGSAFICGAAVQWLRDQLQFVKHASEIEDLASQVEDTDGVEFVPAFTGLGAPYWNPEARACITGLTRGSGRSHIARACLEGMALQNVDLLNAMEKDLKKRLRQLRVDGGACANNLLMQMQSDFLGTKVIRPKNIETTALGAAFLAGLGVGLWKSTKEIKAIWKKDAEFKPVVSKAKREQRLVSWHRAIKASQN